MIIEIDIGNTRIKWRCLQHGVVQARGVVESGERDGWASTIRDNYLPEMIRLACVGDRALVDWVDGSYTTKPEMLEAKCAITPRTSARYLRAPAQPCDVR